jgi:hypothetical protein
MPASLYRQWMRRLQLFLAARPATPSLMGSGPAPGGSRRR